jgi:hypothetical protein
VEGFVANAAPCRTLWGKNSQKIMVCRQNRSTFASAKAKKLSQSQQKEIINKKVKLKK